MPYEHMAEMQRARNAIENRLKSEKKVSEARLKYDIMKEFTVTEGFIEKSLKLFENLGTVQRKDSMVIWKMEGETDGDVQKKGKRKKRKD